MSSRLIPFALSFAFAVLVFYVLISGRDLIIPFAVAVMIWYLINALTHLYQRPGVGGRHLPRWAALTLAILTFGVAITLVVELIGENMAAAAGSAPLYQQHLETLISNMAAFLGLHHALNVDQLIQEIDLRDFLTGLVHAITRLAGNTGIIVIYVTFLFIEQNSFDHKLKALLTDPEREKSVRGMLHRMAKEIQTYISIKTMMSTLVGVITYAILSVAKVDYAAFWGFLVFLLNFIPNIGALAAIIFPSILTLVQFEAVYPFLAVAGSLGVTHLLVGNVLEPRVMGHSLNLSPLVIILSLVLWGTIWGIAGMFLAVPIMVILTIIFSYIPQARPIAVLLSSDGLIKLPSR